MKRRFRFEHLVLVRYPPHRRHTAAREIDIILTTPIFFFTCDRPSYYLLKKLHCMLVGTVSWYSFESGFSNDILLGSASRLDFR